MSCIVQVTHVGVFLLLVLAPAYGQSNPVADTLDWRRYFPLEVGNQWHYRTDFESEFAFFDTWHLTGDTLFDGQAYFILQTCRFDQDRQLVNCGSGFVRYDTTHANVVIRTTSPEGEPVDEWFQGIPCGLDAPFRIWNQCTGTAERAEFWVDGQYGPGLLIIGQDTVVVDADKSFSTLATAFIMFSDVGLVRFVSEGGPRVSLIYAHVGQKRLGEVVLPTAREPKTEVPRDLAIITIYPNPFNTYALVEYRLAEPDWVTVEVYNALGQRVHAAWVGYKTPGRHQYRLKGTGLGGGMYFIRMQTRSGMQAVHAITHIK